MKERKVFSHCIVNFPWKIWNTNPSESDHLVQAVVMDQTYVAQKNEVWQRSLWGAAPTLMIICERKNIKSYFRYQMMSNSYFIKRKEKVFRKIQILTPKFCNHQYTSGWFVHIFTEQILLAFSSKVVYFVVTVCKDLSNAEFWMIAIQKQIFT